MFAEYSPHSVHIDLEMSEVETVRVDICYRPLRICWAVSAGDWTAMRQAMQTSFALWGGRFSPIVVVERQERAKEIVTAFSCDVVIPVGDSAQVKQFPAQFPHLINPLFPKELFLDNGMGGAVSQVLDVLNAFVQFDDKPEREEVQKKGLRLYTWAADDPLANVLLVHFGKYPDAKEIKIDYQEALKWFSKGTEFAIDPKEKLPDDLFEHPNISSISRIGMRRHHRIRVEWDNPGFFSGEGDDFDDLVCFWNIRASDIPVLFVDTRYLERYGETIASWGKTFRGVISNRRNEFQRKLAVWVREEKLDRADMKTSIDAVMGPFRKEQAAILCTVRDEWLRWPPTMYFSEVSTLGVLSKESANPRLTFPLDKKPFSNDIQFHNQHLVASLSIMGALYDDNEHLLTPPHVPELNEFYAREMHFEYDKLRSERGGVGLIVGVCDADTFIFALPVPQLFDRIFGLAGFSANLSAGGLICPAIDKPTRRR